ncbi:hypothetical protein PENTCL1PPCAC_13967, partial [Pristionchus entomophagus]
QYCCGLKSSLEMDGNWMPLFVKDRDSANECRYVIECTDDCGCSVSRCQNRALQKGRQKPLLIFRHPIKGWSLRA